MYKRPILFSGLRKMRKVLVANEPSVCYSTVDQSEIDHLSKQAKDWWDPKGSMAPLHSYNDLRIPFIKNGLLTCGSITDDTKHDCLKGVKILDVGCGGGILSVPLAQIGAEVVGIDPASDLIAVAQEEVKRRPDIKERISLKVTSIEEFSTTNQGAFDAVVMSEVIEHVTKKDEFTKLCVDVVKPGGSVFITTLNKTYATWIAGILLAENVFNLVPKNTHDYEKLISPDDMSQILKKYGCRTVLVNGTFYAFFQNRWYWCPSTQICYALHACKDKNPQQ